MNCGTPGFFDLNWDRSMDPGAGAGAGAGDISLPTQFMPSPLNSPPELHLSMMDHHHHQQQPQHQLGDMAPVPHIAPFSADPGFVERAARFSRFGGGVGQDFGCLAGQSLRANRLQMNLLGPQFEVGGADFGGNREDSSASDPVSESSARKRKAPPKGKGKDLAKDTTTTKLAAEEEAQAAGAKKSRSGDDAKGNKDEIKPKIEQNGGASSSGDDEKKQGKDNNAKLPEPPKDYIHVRARRGQATDSHSLAERVRREKISERMKLLQDLVPGCNKVTGKALMLDEIINYVQSLQRQVEFLSMKLATVNPRLDVNMENLLQKDMHQTNGPLPNSTNYPFEASSGSFPYSQQGTPLQCMVTNGLETQVSMNSLDPTLHRILSMQLPNLDGFRDAASQLGNFWEDDLQNVVQMGFGQSQEMALSSQSFHDSLPSSHMKLDL